MSDLMAAFCHRLLRLLPDLLHFPNESIDCIKDGWHDNSLKVKPNHLDWPLVAGYSIGHKPHPLHVSRQTKKSTRQIKFSKDGFSHEIILITPMLIFLISLVLWFDAILRGFMPWLTAEPCSDWVGGCRDGTSTPWLQPGSLRRILWVQMTPPVQDGSRRIQVILNFDESSIFI